MKRVLFILTFALSMLTVQGQILNGSFEDGMGADLSNWEWICGAVSLNNAPAGGGSWSIQVNGGNTQGCMQGYAYQKMPAIAHGQSFVLSGWAFAELSPSVGLYFGTINNGIIALQAGDTTHSTSWAQLHVQSSFSLSTGDTALVVLDGGLVGGPLQGYGHFDLISLEPLTGIDAPEQPQSTKFYPNPCLAQTTLRTSRPLDNATLTVCNMYGQTVKRMENLRGQTVVLSRANLESGLYSVWLLQDGKVISVDKLVIAD
jgi:hypothetical protein